MTSEPSLLRTNKISVLIIQAVFFMTILQSHYSHIMLNHLIKQLTMGDSIEGFAGIKGREVHSTTMLSKIAGNLLYSKNCILTVSPIIYSCQS